MKRFWTMSLRARLMIIGLAGVGIALIMGGLAFFGALTYSVNRTLDNEALASAREVAAMVNENRLPSPVPVSGAQVVQVVDAQQRVIGRSVTADRLTPLLRPNELARALTGEAVVVDGVRVGASGPLRVQAVHAGPSEAPVSVIVGLPFGDVLATRKALRNALLITFPLLLGALAAIAWRVIGWTLRPVEQLRAGAEQISRTGRIRANDSQYPPRQTRSALSRSPSTRCSIGWLTLRNGSARSWRTRLMSCAARWPASRRSWRSRDDLGRAAPCRPTS